MSREVARADAAGDRAPARALLRTLALVYWATAGVLALGVAAASGWIAQVWLRDSGLSDADVRTERFKPTKVRSPLGGLCPACIAARAMDSPILILRIEPHAYASYSNCTACCLLQG